MLAQQQPRYTHAEYFALEEQSETKNDYVRGDIVAMTGASLNHNRLTRNLVTALTNKLAGISCEAFAGDLRLWIAARDIFTYPDVMVICGSAQFYEQRTDTITNPTVIFEVLSKSTEGYDRSDKFHAYWTLATFEEYILVDQYRLQVEYFRRLNEKEWRLIVLTKADDSLRLEAVGLEISLEQIYRHVTWDD